MDPYEINLKRWDELATFHLETPLYSEMVAKLRAGGDTLLPFDDAVLGDLEGKRVLHLQCHLGTESISLARRGAEVVAVDFSSEALSRAAALANELGASVRFVQSNVFDLPGPIEGRFDLVYTSYGVLCWLGDLAPWGAIVGGFLEEGGRAIVIDSHPLALALAPEQPDLERLQLGYPYLRGDEPDLVDEGGTYADATHKTEHKRSAEWSHGFSEIIDSLLDAGLSFERLSEHPESYWPPLPGMVRGNDGLFRLPGDAHGRYPFTFTLVMRK